jgi:periplasmic protein TonB
MAPLDRSALGITGIIHALVALAVTLYYPLDQPPELTHQTLTASWHHSPVQIQPEPEPKLEPKPVASYPEEPPEAPAPKHQDAPAVSVTESIPLDPQPFDTDRKQPEVYKTVSPVYPKRALINNWEGRVRVVLRIGIGGRIASAKILQSSGFPELDTAYLNSLNQQQYLPQEFRGSAVEGTLEQDYTFSLDE